MKPEYDEAAEYLNKDKNVSKMMVYIQGAFDVCVFACIRELVLFLCV